MTHHEDGYRYVRGYRDKRTHTERWALWQTINGRCKRVGTAITDYDYKAFLFKGPVEQKYCRTNQ